jgi:hypothetical protein
LENDDYKEKLKYLKVKNENIKAMHHLSVQSHESRKFLYKSSFIRSQNVSFEGSLASRNIHLKQHNSSPITHHILNLKFPHSDDDAHVSEFQELHNHPQAGQRNLQEIEVLKQQILQKK